MGTLSMGFPHLTLWSFQNPMTLHFLKFDNSIPWKVTGQNHLKGKQILIYLPFFHPFFVGGWCEQLPVGCCFWCSHDVCCGMKVNFPWLCSLGRSPIFVATDLLFCLDEQSFSLIWGKHYPLTNPIIIPGLSYSFTKLDSIGGVCHHPGSKHGKSPQVLRLRYCSKGLNKKFQNKCRNGDEQNGDFHPADSNFRNSTNHHQKYIQGMDTCEQNTLINVAHLRGCFITENPEKLIMEAPKNEALQKIDFQSFCWKGVILRKPIFLVFFLWLWTWRFTKHGYQNMMGIMF